MKASLGHVPPNLPKIVILYTIKCEKRYRKVGKPCRSLGWH
jgi:hypothetical protein